MELTDIKALKQQYKPEKVDVLFVADGIPVNQRYFYLRNSNMYKAVKDAFTAVFGNFNTDDDFLNFFKEIGAYYDNLSEAPIKILPPAEQKAERQKGIEPLAKRIAEFKPRIIIISLKIIEKPVREAIQLSGITDIEHIEVTPFPVKSMTNVNNCINGIVRALKTVEW